MKIVFIHGAGMNSSCFAPQMKAFKDAAGFELPGHGVPGSAASISQFADAVDQALRNSRDEVILCGHSMGGAIVLEIALRKARYVKACVLFGSGARLRVAPEILAGLADDFDATVHRLARLFFASADEESLAWAEDQMRRTGQEQLLRDFAACNAFDVLERLGEVSQPLLALTGENDVMTPPKYATALAGRVGRGQARIIGGAGHMVMMERPRETNAELSTFLDGLSLTS